MHNTDRRGNEHETLMQQHFFLLFERCHVACRRRQHFGAGHLRTDTTIPNWDSCVGPWVAGPPFFLARFFFCFLNGGCAL